MPAPDHKLTLEARRFIVQRLAWRDSPQSIVDQVKEEFGVAVSRQTIEGYDPVKVERRGKTIKAEWVELYNATRKAIEGGIVEIGMADKMVRLARWERLYHLALARNNLVMAADFLEKASKEANDFYSRTGIGVGFTPPAAGGGQGGGSVTIFQLPDNGRG